MSRLGAYMDSDVQAALIVQGIFQAASWAGFRHARISWYLDPHAEGVFAVMNP